MCTYQKTEVATNASYEITEMLTKPNHLKMAMSVKQLSCPLIMRYYTRRMECMFDELQQDLAISEFFNLQQHDVSNV
jgi:REP element-mobilizing transposase RayT